MMDGVISSFDEVRGDGWFQSSSGEAFYFHCVTIADGSRTIPEGVRASARRCVGHLGVDEVCDVAAMNA